MLKGSEQSRHRGVRDPRTVSPWLLSTKWHEHIEGFETTELRNLISFPGKEELQGLPKLVELYFQDATGLLPSTSELTLQKLNTSDPAKT